MSDGGLKQDAIPSRSIAFIELGRIRKLLTDVFVPMYLKLAEAEEKLASRASLCKGVSVYGTSLKERFMQWFENQSTVFRRNATDGSDSVTSFENF